MKKRIKKKNKQSVTLLTQLKLLFFLTLSLLIYSTMQVQTLSPRHGIQKLHQSTLSVSSVLSILKKNPSKSQSRPLFAIQKVEAEEKNKEYCIQVPVLLYHHIEPIAEAQKEGHAQLTVDSSWFEDQLKYLQANNYTTLSADDLVDALVYGKELPKKSILLTLDDGYVDAYTYAYPLAKEYHVILNLMIPTGLLGKDDYLTWDMLEKMQESGIIHTYSHTVNHVALGLSSQDIIDKEIVDAKNDLKNRLGVDNGIFTYPYGSYSDLAIQELTKYGYVAAFTTDGGTLQCRSQLMKLKRDHAGNLPLSAYGL